MAKPAPISIDEAQRKLVAETPAPVEEERALLEAAGGIAAEDVAIDLDMPPFDKAMMDGFAVLASDPAPLRRIVEDVPAGRVPAVKVAPGGCSRIMTGAPVPEGADAVQQVEKTELVDGLVRLIQPVRPGQNIAPRGQDARKGAPVIRRGQKLRPGEIAVLAAAGRSRVRTYRKPRCAVFATGDELVEPPAVPGPGQIRNSNAYSIAAQVRAMDLECAVLPIARDDWDELAARIREGLTRDVLLISGGVSVGERDLVIPALEAAGVKCLLHQIRIRPGRPFLFGRRERTVIFALPGNPVSTFVTFEVFVRPFLGRMMGDTAAARLQVRARWTGGELKGAERTQYLPAVLNRAGDGHAVQVLPWGGSGDLFTLSRANALAIQPQDTSVKEGDVVEVMVL